MAEKKKIQFEFSSEEMERLERLEALTDAPTKAAVLRRALALYQWVAALDPNGTLGVVDQDGNLVYLIPVQVLRG